MAGSLRSRVLEIALAGARDALETIEARVVLQLPGSAQRQRERTREVIERDRALVETAVPADPPVAAAGTAPSTAPRADVPCDEPIRTRSMAKLLAAQGHPHRALSIYRYLLAHDDTDPALRAEIAAIQAHIRGGEHTAVARRASD